jgi:hypothetical protein
MLQNKLLPANYADATEKNLPGITQIYTNKEKEVFDKLY